MGGDFHTIYTVQEMIAAAVETVCRDRLLYPSATHLLQFLITEFPHFIHLSFLLPYSAYRHSRLNHYTTEPEMCADKERYFSDFHSVRNRDGQRTDSMIS